MKQNRNGFTLIEILVAATIIAVLVAVGVVSYSSTTRNSRDAKRKADVEQIRQAMEMYRADNGSYPGTCASFTDVSSCLSTLQSSGYLPVFPTDPQTTPYLIRMTGSGPPYYAYCMSTDLETDPPSSADGCTPATNYSIGIKNP